MPNIIWDAWICTSTIGIDKEKQENNELANDNSDNWEERKNKPKMIVKNK